MEKDKILLRYKFSEEEDWIEVPVHNDDNPKWDNKTGCSIYDLSTNDDMFKGYIQYTLLKVSTYDIVLEFSNKQSIILEIIKQNVVIDSLWLYRKNLKNLNVRNLKLSNYIDVTQNNLKNLNVGTITTKKFYVDNIKLEGNNTTKDSQIKFEC